jgi:hypothetical protein
MAILAAAVGFQEELHPAEALAEHPMAGCVLGCAHALSRVDRGAAPRQYARLTYCTHSR